MSWPRIAQWFPRRLRPHASDIQLGRMAHSPSYCAPHPRELLLPDPTTQPGPQYSDAEREILEAVLAAPDSDEPRLRYADWWDRRGDVRGEFVRLQLTGSDRSREDELFARNVAEWIAPFALWSARDVGFRRGFAEAMSLSGRAFLSAGTLFCLTPLRDVRLVAVQPFMCELAVSVLLARLERLDLSGNRIGRDGVRALVGSPHLEKLRHLILRGNNMDDVTAEELAGVSLPNLQLLDVSDNPMSHDAYAMLRTRFGSAVTRSDA